MSRTVPIERLNGVLNNERGLTDEEVSARLNRYGPNHVIEISSSGWLSVALETVRDPMLWFLLSTSLLFVFLGDWTEALTLLVAAVPLVGMDLYLHQRTHASTAGLASRLASQAQVCRNSKTADLPATELVPGDLVMLAAGQNVPADGIFIHGEGIQVDESALSGEAYPIRKHPLAELESTSDELAVDSSHWACAGTRLLTGSAAVRIVYTGAETLYGGIVRSASGSRHERTPLQGAIANLVSVLLVAATLLCLVLAWVRLRQGFGVVDAVLSAVTLAVAALPEEFPVVFTFFLGVGVYRLAQRHALVRRSVVVENIGRVSCICTDKTGTLTEGLLQLTHAYPDPDISEQHLLAVAARASRKESGDPMDQAILCSAPAGGIPDTPVTTYPFTEDRKRETTVWRNAGGRLRAVTKGAPETILPMCRLADEERAASSARVNELAASGHKVIACAELEVTESGWAGGEPEGGFTLVGLLAFEDPVREGVTESIRQCRDSGIHVIMVTGDHPVTARAVACEIGLGSGNPEVIEGDQLDVWLSGGGDKLKRVDVIARAVPAQKLSLVRGLQRSGEIVAVTGDGVNDVPALQAADIGLAMGERGTRSARDVAAIVLLDDNFRTITRAVAEGRQLFINLKLSFAYLLMIHIPLVLTAALIPLAGYPMLYLPIHIVWMELIIHPTALLVFQELPASQRLEPIVQTTKRLRFFSRLQWVVIAGVGAVAVLMIIAGYERSLGAGGEVEHARAMTMVMLSFFSAAITTMLSGLSGRMSRILVGATIVVTLLFVQIPALATLLHLKPLHLDDLFLSILAALGIATLALFGRFRNRV